MEKEVGHIRQDAISELEVEVKHYKEELVYSKRISLSLNVMQSYRIEFQLQLP